jgi:hypothetical protein
VDGGRQSNKENNIKQSERWGGEKKKDKRRKKERERESESWRRRWDLRKKKGKRRLRVRFETACSSAAAQGEPWFPPVHMWLCHWLSPKCCSSWLVSLLDDTRRQKKSL